MISKGGLVEASLETRQLIVTDITTNIDKIATLNALHVLPDHSEPGDGSLVTQEKAFIADVRTRALALKKQGVSVDDAGKQLSAELKTRYSDWPYMNVAAFVKSVYAE